jgi:hypothetical protein
LKPFIDQLFLGNGVVDFALTELKSTPVREPRGFTVQNKPGETVKGSFEKQEEPDDEKGPFESEVIVRNLGDVELPVEVRFVFEDGVEYTETWDGRGWKLFRFGKGTERDSFTNKLIEAEVDPKHLFAIDLNTNNNGMRLERNKETVTSLCAWITFWAQNYLAGLAFFW